MRCVTQSDGLAVKITKFNRTCIAIANGGEIPPESDIGCYLIIPYDDSEDRQIFDSETFHDNYEFCYLALDKKLLLGGYDETVLWTYVEK